MTTATITPQIINAARIAYGRDTCRAINEEGYGWRICCHDAIGTCQGCNERFCRHHLAEGHCPNCPAPDVRRGKGGRRG